MREGAITVDHTDIKKKYCKELFRISKELKDRSNYTTISRQSMHRLLLVYLWLKMTGGTVINDMIY